MIQILFQSETVELGNEIVGQVSVSANRNKLPKEIEISLQWRTEGRGEQDRGTVGTLSPRFRALKLANPATISVSLYYSARRPDFLRWRFDSHLVGGRGQTQGWVVKISN